MKHMQQHGGGCEETGEESTEDEDEDDRCGGEGRTLAWTQIIYRRARAAGNRPPAVFKETPTPTLTLIYTYTPSPPIFL